MRSLFRFLVLIIVVTSCNFEDRYSHLEDYLSHGNLPKLKEGKMIQVSSFDTTGANNDRINIHAGQKAIIFNPEGPGLITRIWITIDSRDPHFLRRILLRMYWDNEENPSVEVPVGDFFGCGYEYKHYTSQYLGMSSGGYYCYFPMPFNKAARIEVVNETGQEIYAFYYQIDYFELDKPFDDQTAYFHASWNRDIRTDYRHNYTILEASGKGHFIGCNIHAEPYAKSFWYLEGDEMVYVDGEKNPSIYGTGTEDYFTSGWYYKNGEFAAAYHGLVLKDEETKRTVAYRHHIPDPIPFDESILFTMEHGHANEEVIDLSSTAYWYQLEPHRAKIIKKSSLRIPLREVIPTGCLEAEDMSFSSDSLEGITMDMSNFGAEWSNLKQLMVKGKPEQSFTISVSDLYEKKYNATVYLTRGPDYGMIQVHAGDNLPVQYDGFQDNVYPGAKIHLNNLETQNGGLDFHFLVTGKNKAALGYDVGIDAIKLNPVREYIPSWHLLGPFPNRRESDILRYGLDEVFPPEQNIDLNKTYTGVDNKPIKWVQFSTPEHGYFSLWDKFDPYEFIVSYALTYIYSPEKQSVPLLLGSDDGSKVFLNKKELYRFLDVRIASPDQDTVNLELQKGWNELLLKIENNFGGYAFYARLIDRKENLQSGLPPQVP